jgi:branched-chain amino acid transport system permease protein
MKWPIQIRIDPERTPSGYVFLVPSGAGMALVLGLTILGFDAATGFGYTNILTSLVLWLIIALGFQVFVGSTGAISFGHPAFVALGAYTAGLLTLPAAMEKTALPHLPIWLAEIELGLWPALLVGAAVPATLALVIGPIVMRLTGIAAGIMTFGLLVIVNEVIRNATPLTRGNATFYGVPRLTTLAECVLVMVAVVAVCLAYKYSRWGLRARAVSQDPIAAEMTGIRVVTARIGAFVLSAFICGLGGALMAFFLTAFSAKSFYIGMVLPMMIIVLLGGMNSVAGVLTGAVILTFWQHVMRLIETGGLGFAVPPGLSDMTLGLGLVAILYFRPAGLLGSGEVLFKTNKDPLEGDGS